MKFYHHQSIKKYTIALLELFSNFNLQRYNENGEVIKEFTVPIKFGNREKAFILQDFNNKDLIKGNINYFPRMILEFNSMSKASNRNTNKNSKIKFKSEDGIKKYFYNSVAYNFNFTLYIATKGFTDATVLIEQIAPLFRPDVTVKIQELDIIDEPTSVQVSIGDFEIELPDVGDEPKIVKVSLPITLKGNLYLPIKDAKIIKDIKLKLNAIQADFDRKGIEYNLEEPAYLIEAKENKNFKNDIDKSITEVTQKSDK